MRLRRSDIGNRFDAGKIANMAESTPLTTAEVDAFLNDLLVDAHDEEEPTTGEDAWCRACPCAA